MNLGDAAVLGVPQGADQGDDVEAELVVWQGEATLLLGSQADAAALAVGVSAGAELEVQSDDAFERGDRSLGLGRGPGGPSAGGAGLGGVVQLEGAVRERAGGPSRHRMPPQSG
jgi:hypothetical protein